MHSLLRQVAWKCLHHLRSGLISMQSAADWVSLMSNLLEFLSNRHHFSTLQSDVQRCETLESKWNRNDLSSKMSLFYPTLTKIFYHTMTQFTRPCTTSNQITSMGTHRRLFLTKLTRKHFSNRHILYSILKVIWWHTTTMLWQQIIVQRRVPISLICVNLSI